DSDGGQLSDGGGGGGGSRSSSRSSARVRVADTGNDAAEGPAESDDDVLEEGRSLELVQNTTDNGPPQISEEPPPRERERLAIVKAVARTLTTLAEFVEFSANFPGWFLDYSQVLRTSLDEPKTLEQLQRDASSPGIGYDLHHIVEQTPAEKNG